MVGKRLCTNKCNHYFHPACLHDWFNSRKSQPQSICRALLDRNDLEASMQAKMVLYYEMAQRAKHLNNYTAMVNDEADALIKYGSISKHLVE